MRGHAGFHYCTTLLHKVQMALKLETDPSEILNELIYACRKVRVHHLRFYASKCLKCLIAYAYFSDLGIGVLADHWDAMPA